MKLFTITLFVNIESKKGEERVKTKNEKKLVNSEKGKEDKKETDLTHPRKRGSLHPLFPGGHPSKY